MKVTILSPRFGGASGIGRHVQVLMEKLKEREHQVKIISTHNTPYIQVKNLKNLSWALAACLIKTDSDVVHAHNLPSIVPAKFSRGGKILTLHGYYSAQIRLLHGNLLGQMSSIFEKRVLNWADVITCVSKRTAELYRELGFKVRYIPNAVDYEKIKSLCNGIQRRPKRIVYVGRKSMEKGYDIFQTLAKDKEFAKEGYEFQAVYDKPWEKAIKILASATMLILPSRVEGLPTIILESFACGTPVIASNIGGVDELIEDHQTGLTFTPEDLKNLKEQVQILLNDETLWKRLSLNGEKKMEKEYEWGRVVQQYEEVYNSIIN